MQKIILFIMMIFAYPVIFFSSLHLIKSNYELKYTLFRIWSRFFLKRASAKVVCEHSELIPLENDYVFLVNHESKLDCCILAEALPVQTHFILDKSERVPYLNTYLKRLNAIFVSYENCTLDQHINTLEDYLNESSITLFMNTLNNEACPECFLEIAKTEKWTLIPISISGSKKLMKKGRHHHVKVDIKVPLYFEEYGKFELNEIQNQILLRLDDK